MKEPLFGASIMTETFIETVHGNAVITGGQAKRIIDKIGKAFEGNTQATSNAITEQEKFLRLQLETRIQIQQQEKALAGLAEQRQILQDISDDDTIGFVTRTKAVERAQKAAVDFAKQENELALLKEKLTIGALIALVWAWSYVHSEYTK